MWRIRSPARLGLSILGFEFYANDKDIIDPKSPTAQRLADEFNKKVENETGWDRVKEIFKLDPIDNSISYELDNTLTGASFGTVIGFFMGAIPASKIAHNNFIDKNKASTFTTHFEAKEKLQFAVTKAMSVNGFRVGWRLGLFTGCYVFFTSAIATYRGKSSFIEYSAGGAAAGAVYKFPMGPKAMVSGGLAGGALGTIAGLLTLAILKFSGTTAEEIRFWRKGYKEYENRHVTALDCNRRQQGLVDPIGIGHELGLVEKNLAAAGSPSPIDLSVIPDEDPSLTNEKEVKETSNNKQT